MSQLTSDLNFRFNICLSFIFTQKMYFVLKEGDVKRKRTSYLVSSIYSSNSSSI